MHADSRFQSHELRSRLASVLVLSLLAGYAIFLWRHAVVVPGGSDSSGYFNGAKALLEGRVHATPRELDGLPMATLPAYAYAPLGFIPSPGTGSLTPSYPVGLPLLFAGASGLFGWQLGPMLVIVLHSLGSIVMTYGLARASGLTVASSLLCAAAIAVSPLHVMFSLQAMSDVPALFWSGMALLGAIHGGRRTAIGVGFAIGLAVLIRPTNALIAIPVLLAFGRDWRRWLACGLGGLPAAIFLGWHNLLAFGAVLATGYGSVWDAFAREWILPGLTNYARWLPVLLSPLLLLAAAAVLARPAKRKAMFLHACWVLLLAGVYSAYYHTQETWWYLRFILPAFPSLSILAALGAERLLERRRPVLQTTAWMAALLLIVFNGWHWCRHFGAHHAGLHERTYPAAIAMIQREVPAGGIVLAMQMSGVLYHSTDHPIVRWDQIDDTWPRIRSAAADSGRPVYAALFPFELAEGFAQRVPGRWEKISEAGVVSLWRLSPGQP